MSKRFKHGLMAMKKTDIMDDTKTASDIVHFCGFWKKPTLNDYVSLYKELATDKEFDLIGVDVVILPAPKQVVKDHFDFYKEHEEEGRHDQCK